MTKRKVYILLTDTGSVLTKLIKLYTKKPYNHASIAFDSNLSEVYSFGRKHSDNPFVGGFVKEDVTSNLFLRADCVIYSFTVDEEQYNHMKLYIEQFKEQEDEYKYNFLGLFGVMLNKPVEKDKAYFCSQFVASVLEQSKNIEFEKSLALIAPHDLQNVPEFEFVYEGNLNDYTRTSEVQLPIQFNALGV